jgi:hypothetical protein
MRAASWPSAEDCRDEKIPTLDDWLACMFRGRDHGWTVVGSVGMTASLPTDSAPLIVRTYDTCGLSAVALSFARRTADDILKDVGIAVVWRPCEVLESQTPCGAALARQKSLCAPFPRRSATSLDPSGTRWWTRFNTVDTSPPSMLIGSRCSRRKPMSTAPFFSVGRLPTRLATCCSERSFTRIVD